MKIEGIPKPGAKIYSNIVSVSPIMKDFYQEVTVEVLSKLSSGKILDIGTGPGYVPIKIAENSDNLEIKAIDVSPAMVDIAAKNAQKSGLSRRIEFRFGRAGSIPFSDGYFDLVISTLSFHHWANPEECLKEINRVLKNGGEAWIYELRRDMTREAKIQLRHKYGWFLYLLIMYFVRLHSSTRADKVQQFLSLAEIGFSEKNVEDRGHVIKMRLLKKLSL
jgi:ubiquinone/menaquinone biosynthesis C-methylase UbiE